MGVDPAQKGIWGAMPSLAHLPKAAPTRGTAAQNDVVPKIDNGLAAILRALLALALCAAWLVGEPPAALQTARFAVVVPGPPIGQPAEAAMDGARCADPAGTWLGMRWRSELKWRVNEKTIPAYLGDRTAVVNALRSAATTVDTGRNDCGLPENLGISESYTGKTDRIAGVTPSGGCGDRDGQNAVSFGPLNQGLLAVTCIWWYGGKENGRLPVTFQDFEDYGIHRHAIAPAIRELESLGFIRIIKSAAPGMANFASPTSSP